MNYYRMNEKEVELIGKIIQIVSTDYNIHGEFIPVESFISMIEDLYDTIQYLQEQLEDVIQDRNDNYKPISTQEEIGYDIRTW